MGALRFGTKQQAGYAISILHSGSFQSGRASTPTGRRLFNRELLKARRAVRRYKITLARPLPDPMEVRR